MSWQLVLILAVVTYGSRMAAMTILPPMPPAIGAVLDRMPPALFAGLAVTALLTPGGFASWPVLAAAAGALAAAPLRSLPACLIAGFAAYALASLIAA